MNRRALILYLKEHECYLFREGRKHSVFVNIKTSRTSTVPRHSEINNFLANKICKDLNIPGIKD